MLHKIWSSIDGAMLGVEVPESVEFVTRAFIAENTNEDMWCASEFTDALAEADYFRDLEEANSDADDFRTAYDFVDEWLEDTAKTDIASFIAAFCEEEVGVTQHGSDDFAIETH